MVSKKYLHQIQALLLSGLMSLIMSGAISLINLGPVQGFMAVWIHAWIVAYAIAFPAILLVFAFARRLAAKIASKE
jgi:TRAP-type C4-dicarboxylate transport system permease small subunit